MNTITFNQLEAAIKTLDQRAEACGYEYHEAHLLNAQGEDCGEAEAVYAEIYLLDHKGRHDYYELDALMRSVGVSVDRAAMMAPFEVDRYLSDEDNEPRAWLVEGDGECEGEYCRLWGYALLLTK